MYELDGIAVSGIRMTLTTGLGTDPQGHAVAEPVAAGHVIGGARICCERARATSVSRAGADR
jgi:hypothetical protein